MKAEDLRAWIESLTQDIDFQYQGYLGSICPFNRNNISLCYDEEEVTVYSVDAAMSEPFIRGKSLQELSEVLDI